MSPAISPNSIQNFAGISWATWTHDDNIKLIWYQLTRRGCDLRNRNGCGAPPGGCSGTPGSGITCWTGRCGFTANFFRQTTRLSHISETSSMRCNTYIGPAKTSKNWVINYLSLCSDILKCKQSESPKTMMIIIQFVISHNGFKRSERNFHFIAEYCAIASHITRWAECSAKWMEQQI